MFAYLARRLTHSFLVLVGVLVIVFFMVSEIGDPARLMLPISAPPGDYEALRAKLGLDRPLIERLWDTVLQWSHGNFGDSSWQGTSAIHLALDRIPATLYLTAVALLIAVPLALFLGARAAMNPDSLSDRLVTLISLFGFSVASFWLGLMLILVLAIQFQLLPTSGYGGLNYVLLPALTLAAKPLGRLAQITRATLIEEMEKPYVTALRVKGLSTSRIVYRHALKNAAIPIITIFGDELATFLNGAVVVEVIFAWPGIGNLFINAIQQRDLALVEACVFVVAIMTIAVNLLVDLAYSLFDPRTRVQLSPSSGGSVLTRRGRSRVTKLLARRHRSK